MTYDHFKETLSLVPWFSEKELTHTDTGLYNSVVNCEPCIYCNLLRLVFCVLLPLRFALGRPILINSAFRNVLVNRQVGGVSNSKHLYGLAADIRPLSSTPLKDLDKLETCCKSLSISYIRYPNFIHVQLNS